MRNAIIWLAVALSAFSPSAASQVPPAPVCWGCTNMNNTFPQTDSCLGTISENATCSLNANGDACLLSGTVTFAAASGASWDTSLSFYGNPPTVLVAAGTYTVGGGGYSVSCFATTPRVAAYVIVRGTGGCLGLILQAQKTWDCEPV